MRSMSLLVQSRTYSGSGNESWAEIALESKSLIHLYSPPSVTELVTLSSGNLLVVSLDSSVGNSVTDTERLPFQGLSNGLRRSLSTVVPSGYTFPGFFGTVLSLPDRLGPSSVVPLGPASPGGGPKVPRPRVLDGSP